jgi:hypothetical protein
MYYTAVSNDLNSVKMPSVNILQYHSGQHRIYKNGNLKANFQLLWKSNSKQTETFCTEQRSFSP